MMSVIKTKTVIHIPIWMENIGGIIYEGLYKYLKECCYLNNVNENVIKWCYQMSQYTQLPPNYIYHVNQLKEYLPDYFPKEDQSQIYIDNWCGLTLPCSHRITLCGKEEYWSGNEIYEWLYENHKYIPEHFQIYEGYNTDPIQWFINYDKKYNKYLQDNS